MADSVLEQIAALKDEDWAIREEAASMLASFRDARAVVPLVALLSDPDRAVRDAAIAALTAIGDASVLPASTWLRNGDLLVQGLAASILVRVAARRELRQLGDGLA